MKFTHLALILTVAASPAVAHAQTRGARPAAGQTTKPTIQVFEGAG